MLRPRQLPRTTSRAVNRSRAFSESGYRGGSYVVYSALLWHLLWLHHGSLLNATDRCLMLVVVVHGAGCLIWRDIVVLHGWILGCGGLGIGDLGVVLISHVVVVVFV